MKKKVIIIGAGPAGLAAATEFKKDNLFNVTIIEKSNSVGGLAKTIKYKKNLFDIGPHRFFTKNAEINNFYKKYAGKDLIKVKRLTRIRYKSIYYNYPLTPFSTFFKLGLKKSIKIIISYFMSSFFYSKKISSFEDWIIKNFGKELYLTFFKTYTEKIWGISCKKIGSDWAGQRIKGLNLFAILKSFLYKSYKMKSLIDEFFYTKKGAGNLYNNIKNKIKTNILFNTTVVRYNFYNKKITSVIIEDVNGRKKIIKGDFFLSSSPITETIKNFNIVTPIKIKKIISSLKYRNHIAVQLLITGKLFKDNWIYIHSPEVKVARISNYINFSKFMSSSKNLNPITMEYFCDENSDFWKMKDKDLIELAKKEILYLSITNKKNIKDGFVIRSEKAYPTIEKTYQNKTNSIKNYLAQFKNFVPIGRTGMFKYNNQDHAILTGLIGARKIMNNPKLDPWLVNTDAEYHELKD
jgi:protoporphyrinogen oxidase